MIDYLSIGCTPAGEPCVGVGEDNYNQRAREECRRFKAQLEATFPQWEDMGARFSIKSFPHDFGSYMEVCVVFDDANEKAIEFAYFVESNTPENWEDAPAPILMDSAIEDKDRRRGLYGPEYSGESF